MGEEEMRKLDKNWLKYPICGSYGRYKNGPEHLIIFGKQGKNTYGFDFKKQTMSILSSKSPIKRIGSHSSSATGIIIQKMNSYEYVWFSYKTFAWMKKTSSLEAKKYQHLVPIQFDKKLCNIPSHDEL